jgi:hypothetical protein
MFRGGWGLGGESWSWRRRLWAWEEEMLEECRLLLANVSVQSNVFDRWQWDPDTHEGYTVKGAYKCLTIPVDPTFCATDKLVWHKKVPLKVSIVAWRLLKDRLPTKRNLQRRGALQGTSNTCVSGRGMVETTSHLFFIVMSLVLFGIISDLG